MLRPRITPVLLVHDKGLVKTIGFSEPKYVGDPINAVKIFNEKEVDELIVLDIDASALKREPDYRMIENLAAESRMPLCYGGGVKTADQARAIIGLGVEKVAISSGALTDPTLVAKVAQEVGSQSVVVVLDVRKNWLGKFELWSQNGKFNTGLNPAAFAQQVEKFGAGEIVINSINNDGQMKGYDLALVDSIRQVTNLPMTVVGGAGSLKDIADLIGRFGIIGAGAGSLFIFKGVYKAVLINYPSPEEKDLLIRESMSMGHP
jgi:cyclase